MNKDHLDYLFIYEILNTQLKSLKPFHDNPDLREHQHKLEEELYILNYLIKEEEKQ